MAAAALAMRMKSASVGAQQQVRATGLRAFSNFSFTPPPNPTQASTSSPPLAEPSTNLFLSRLRKCTNSEGLEKLSRSLVKSFMLELSRTALEDSQKVLVL